MDPVELRHIETEVFLEAVYTRFGYDYRGYARASMRRRVEALRQLVKVEHIADLVPWMMRTPDALMTIISNLSVPVTEMFRDPEVFHYLRENIIPELSRLDEIRIWQAGCATGEEAYTLAILMKEAGLLDRTQIFATDINERALAVGEEGIYPAQKMEQYEKNYLRSGGSADFSGYFTSRYGAALLAEELRSRVYFSRHNLVTDASFNSFHLIFCRNVLIYFEMPLRERVLRLFRDSMEPNGYLCLGTKETLRTLGVSGSFEQVDDSHRLYRYLSTQGRRP